MKKLIEDFLPIRCFAVVYILLYYVDDEAEGKKEPLGSGFIQLSSHHFYPGQWYTGAVLFDRMGINLRGNVPFSEACRQLRDEQHRPVLSVAVPPFDKIKDGPLPLNNTFFHFPERGEDPLYPAFTMLWVALSPERGPNGFIENLNHFYGCVSFSRLIRSVSIADMGYWDEARLHNDKRYPEERRHLLILLFTELFLVLIDWATIRSQVTAAIRECVSQGRHDDIADILFEYCTSEEGKFEEHLEKVRNPSPLYPHRA
ncbi:hypothetical protein BJ508DRAFT_380179 [Ascobolus immersus RN42]|uniref:Uncharacterized protein n=1 Tax=Ascobolus immersus RN42 TaxID=1160509 RepID=A0A3N4I055_ASCIM|nr:hypothetical protein BJ508DRAFT_380179 [Ascobolus immersus RN42]